MVISFAQDEINWFHSSNDRKKVTSWEDLKQRMFNHFQPTGKGSIGAWLIRIMQDCRIQIKNISELFCTLTKYGGEWSNGCFCDSKRKW